MIHVRSHCCAGMSTTVSLSWRRTAKRCSALLQSAYPHAVLVDTGSVERWNAVTQTVAGAAQIPTLICPLPSVHLVGAQLGAADFLPKPVMRDDLALVLKRLPDPPHSILVIDDDPHIVRLMGRMLRSIASDVRVLEAFGGEEGLVLARAHRPDVIFVDLKMPGLSGQRFIEIAASESQLASIPIIVVSVRSIESGGSAADGRGAPQTYSGVYAQ